MKKNKQVHIFKFLAVSTLTGLVGLGTFALLTNINIVWDTLFGISTGIVTSDPFWITISEVVSVLFSSSVSFGLNKKFTFTGRRARRKGILLYLLYYLISTGLGALLIIYLNKKGLYIVYCKVVKMCINVICDYLYCKFFLFPAVKKASSEAILEDVTVSNGNVAASFEIEDTEEKDEK